MGTFFNSLTNFFISNRIIEEENKDIYRYGFEILFSSIVNILIILVCGIVFNAFFESIIFLAIIIPLRLFTGGYHADTYLMCNILFLVAFILILFIYKFAPEINYLKYIYISLIVLSELIIIRFSPVENSNKKLTQEKRIKYRRISLIISLLICCLILFLYILNIKLYLFIILILFTSALLMIKPNHERRNKHER
jgi:accessory gene regulator B